MVIRSLHLLPKPERLWYNHFMGFGKLGQHGLDYGLNTQITIENAAQQNGRKLSAFKVYKLSHAQKKKVFSKTHAYALLLLVPMIGVYCMLTNQNGYHAREDNYVGSNSFVNVYRMSVCLRPRLIL